MSDPNQERRSSNRNEVALSAVVKGRESEVDFWKETTEIVTVSRLGASFNLSRECQVGRIVSLMVKMPKEFRCYDHDKSLYRVWGLVQHCSPVNQKTAYQIGIAFIGKYAPEDYLKDPLKTYRIVGMDEDGFWNVGETMSRFVSRAYHRFPSVLAVRIALLDEDNEESKVDLDAVTENISAGGASVFSSLEVETGDAVRFKCDFNDFNSLAVVRNRQVREGDRTSVHLEFSRLFPIRDLDLSFEDAEEGETLDDPEVAAALSDEVESSDEYGDIEPVDSKVDETGEKDDEYGNISIDEVESPEDEEYSEDETVEPESENGDSESVVEDDPAVGLSDPESDQDPESENDEPDIASDHIEDDSEAGPSDPESDRDLDSEDEEIEDDSDESEDDPESVS